jgi:hypothetical protein
VSSPKSLSGKYGLAKRVSSLSRTKRATKMTAPLSITSDDVRKYLSESTTTVSGFALIAHTESTVISRYVIEGLPHIWFGRIPRIIVAEGLVWLKTRRQAQESLTPPGTAPVHEFAKATRHAVGSINHALHKGLPSVIVGTTQFIPLAEGLAWLLANRPILKTRRRSRSHVRFESNI